VRLLADDSAREIRRSQLKNEKKGLIAAQARLEELDKKYPEAAGSRTSQATGFR